MRVWNSSRGLALVITAWLLASVANANGPIGEHVNNLDQHLATYAKEVDWLIVQVDGLVDSYADEGADGVETDKVVDYWEAVDFHSAIETNFIPLYAEIWQGLVSVKMAIDEGAPVSVVRQKKAALDSVLWQSLGAVKVAAQYQQRGLLEPVSNTEAESPVQALDIILRELDRVAAKYAEQLPDEANQILQSVYANQFEAIEDTLKGIDEDAVEAIELGFNVTLPMQFKEGVDFAVVKSTIVDLKRQLEPFRAPLAA